MTKTFTKIFAAIIFAFITVNSYSQTKAFNSMSVGLDISTTGGGLEVSSNINSFINLRAGFSALPFSYNYDFDIDYNTDVLYELRTNYSSELAANNISLSHLENVTADLKAKTGLYNGKILVDIHPFKSSSFHVTAGVYFGKKRLVTIKGRLPEETWRTANDVNNLIGRNPSWGLSPVELGVVVGDNTIQPDDNGMVDAGIQINGIKPYFGIGFGRTISQSQWGFQFDLGCMYHGTPKIVSKNAGVVDVLNDELGSSDFIDIMNKVKFYPVISFKVTKKIF
ncbi:MAG: hypothetical protein LUF90_04055 [Rikenellaceae bacterium]|nr:hypothetical protein [Rikenellaceae bacterium]